ncbi:MAG: U32 family peptidase [Bacteriovoracaceae bacterium]|nr:U32 family peptidase [Bacteriovoracaceae bacterium]
MMNHSIKKISSSTQLIPELLAPAGSLEKLRVAVLYGANAVYLGAQQFGLRAAAENFNDFELKQGVEFAHAHHVKVYLVLNSFPFDEDLDALPDFLSRIKDLNIDAVIVSDLGMARVVSRYSQLQIHTSTQASCLNSGAAEVWKDVGATRIVLGREASLKEAEKIKARTGLEMEMFVHGSLCMAYSGHCVISNYTQGRDSNRGGCAHSCRFHYEMNFGGKVVKESTFMSSKDLNGINLLPQFRDAGIDSLKVEGRMKGPLYAAITTKMYAKALRVLSSSRDAQDYLASVRDCYQELSRIPHRDYTEAALISRPTEDSIYQKREQDTPEFPLMAWVREVVEGKFIVLEVRKTFLKEDDLEAVPFDGSNIPLKLDFLTDMAGKSLAKTNPSTLVKIPFHADVFKWNVIRRKPW